MTRRVGYLLVNFGGPRSLEEIPAFLKALLGDQDVIRTPFPSPLHRLIFNRVASKRAKKIAHDYQLIGGKSPIYDDTEWTAQALKLGGPIFTFHRYLPSTHRTTLEQIEEADVDEIRAFPFFPQFSYATTGSSARWFVRHLKRPIEWIKSYPIHPAYIGAFQKTIRNFLEEKGLLEEETLLFFSAHGVPRSFIDTGDPYEDECRASYAAIGAAFPKAQTLLAFQSKFGKGEWLRPYTEDVCRSISLWKRDAKQIVFIPLSFTSDHIETLFEVEYQYLPLIREQNLAAHRCPALGRSAFWLEAIQQILLHSPSVPSRALVRI